MLVDVQVVEYSLDTGLLWVDRNDDTRLEVACIPSGVGRGRTGCLVYADRQGYGYPSERPDQQPRGLDALSPSTCSL